ncbi:MAG: ribonuclease III [Chloroflexi bacterium]|nr:ribonuclease III [Chloroflexota bacterium]
MEQALQITFANRGLLEQALVHRSHLNEWSGPPLESNERLEFLGDAVLGSVAAEYLYSTYPQLPEGELTTLRAALVRAETLAKWAKELGLGEHLLMGRGEEASGGRQRPRILAATFEAVLGAIYLDQGATVAREIVLRFLAPAAEAALASQSLKDYKTRLQELTQAEYRVIPSYHLVEMTGPDHARRFTVEVMLGGEPLAQGVGRSKRIAEQEAARNALGRWVRRTER